MLVDGQARVFVEVRTVSHDDQSPHAPPLPPIVQPDSTNRENRPGERLHLPVAGLSLWLRASGPYSRATRKAAAMTGYSVVVGERRGSARSRPPKLAIPSRPRLEWTPPALRTPWAMRETSSASWRPARPATSRSGTSERTSRYAWTRAPRTESALERAARSAGLASSRVTSKSLAYSRATAWRPAEKRMASRRVASLPAPRA